MGGLEVVERITFIRIQWLAGENMLEIFDGAGCLQKEKR
jgi:hypothetical protein